MLKTCNVLLTGSITVKIKAMMKCSQCGFLFDYWSGLLHFTFKIKNDKGEIRKVKGLFCNDCFTRLLKLENKNLNFRKQ